jgi:two-component system osmolarity sensor histidine kinase EnvZ
MDFGWLKRVLPRGLYGRAALILLVPVVTLQIVVSGQILQRYFRDVAAQMTTALVLDLDLLRSRMAEGEPVEALAEALEIGIAPAPDGTLTDRRLFYDLTGAEAIRVLHRDLPGLIAVDLVSDERFPAVILRAGDEIVSLSVSRRRLSASNPHQLLVLMVFFGLFMTWVAYIFLRNQLKPIRRLAEASEAFGKGQLIEYNPSGATEVRSAGRAFLDMRGRIEAMIDQMLNSDSQDDYVAAVRALDRVLTAERYVVPFWHNPVSRIAYASDLRFPDVIPIYGDWIGWQPDVWWVQP